MSYLGQMIHFKSASFSTLGIKGRQVTNSFIVPDVWEVSHLRDQKFNGAVWPTGYRAPTATVYTSGLNTVSV